MKTNNNNTNTNMKTTSNRKDKKWLRNPDQRKNTKVFSVKMVQTKKGDFVLMGGHSQVFSRKNQYSGEWVPVDTRDLACELRNNRLITR
jgi:hypothetical protein